MRSAYLAAMTVAVVLAVASCSGSSSPAPSAEPSGAAPAASAATGSSVSIANLSFQPATITVPVGTTVTWTNNDSTGHTVTADDGSFRSDRLAPGATFSHTFAAAGTFSYHCSIHSSMKATVVAT